MRILKSSTIKLLRESGLKNVLNFNSLFMYLYARWPDKYIKIARRFLPSKTDPEEKAKIANRYHGKVMTHELTKKIISIDKDIPLQDLEQIIPYPVARNIVLTNPLDIVVLECPCRASSPQPCSPSMVCMIIGRPFTEFILEHHPHKSKRITQDEGLQLLEEVHLKGCVHTAFFKESCLERFYAICNCCKCCCAGLEAMVKHGIPMLAPSGFSAKIDSNICTECGICLNRCPFEAVTESCEVIQEKCMGCGACISSCKVQAITLSRDETKGIPLDVSVLSS